MTDDTDSLNFRSEQEEQSSEEAFQQAVTLVLGGQGIEQVLSSLAVPENLKDKLRKRLLQALQEHEIHDHEMARQTREQSADRSGGIGKLFSMSMLAGVISQKTLEKIQVLFTQNPQLANQIKEQGRVLLRSGVMPEVEFQQGASIAPSTGVGISKGQQRGA